MSLTAALGNAKSGLSATQRQVAGSSDNIANARTPGYVAKEARITSLNTAGFATGVSADMLRSEVDSVLLRDVRLEAAKLGTLDVRALAVSRVETVVGEPSDARSVASALTQLEIKLQALFDAPERADLQREVYQAASDLTRRFGDAEDAIQASRTEADTKISDGVRIVNESLTSIAELNLKVAEGFASNDDISGILDERDRLIDAVSEQIGIRTFMRDRGEIVITTTEGVTLLDGDPRVLNFTQTPVINAATPPGSLSGLTVDGFDIAPSPPGGTQDLRTGSIAGLFIARDIDLPAYQAQIDALAKETIVLFQEADASIPAGGPPFTAGLFSDAANLGVDPAEVAANIVGLAGEIKVNDLVNPDIGGDTSLIRDGILGPPVGTDIGYSDQIAAFLDALATDRNFAPAAGLTNFTTLQGFASEFSTGVLNDRANLENSADRTRVVFDTLEIRRFNETGVNVDEEAERLLELEQAYAANAQVINTVARMFDELLARIAN